MNLTRAETLCLTLIPLPFSEYMRHPDRLEYESLGHEQREWAFRSLQQRGFITFTGRLPAATLRDYWSISSREIEDTLRLFMKDGYVRVVDYNWVLTPQGVALLQGNRVRVVTRRKVQ